MGLVDLSKSNIELEKREYNRQQEIRLKNIVEAIDYWYSDTHGKIPTAVGAIIQRYAMRKLFFFDYLYGKVESMDTLRREALKRLQDLSGRELGPSVTVVTTKPKPKKKSSLSELAQMSIQELSELEMALVEKKNSVDRRTKMIRNILKLQREGYGE